MFFKHKVEGKLREGLSNVRELGCSGERGGFFFFLEHAALKKKRQNYVIQNTHLREI